MQTYIPLYRKYRPQCFADLVGQDSIVKTLSNAVTLNRITHAYLFTGPRGTGKTSTARILAKSLNCNEGPTVNPCGKCPSCIDIAHSGSVDVIEIDAASNRKVEDARNLLEKVHFVPVAGKYKIYIIDEVHMLTTEAFNTLLKTLEEPPKNLVFILATTESHKVLNTIISRCQRFDFKRVPQELIIGQLRHIADTENIKINDKALTVIARKAFGGMRDAIGLLDQAGVLANQGVEITENDIHMLFGSLSGGALYNIAQALADKDTIMLMGHAGKAIESCEPVNVLRELVNYFRNLLIIKTSSDIEQIKPLLDLSDDIIDEMGPQVQLFETDEVIQIIEKLCEYERLIKTTSQQHMWLEIALLSICHRQDMQVVRDLEERISRLESGKTTVTSHELPEPPESGVIEPQPLPPAGDLWQKLLSKIHKTPSKTFFMSLGKPVEINSERLVITFSNENFVNSAKDSGKYMPLEQAAGELFGKLPKIIIRTPQPEDVHSESVEPEPEKKKIDPPEPKQPAQITIDTEPENRVIEEEIAQQLEDVGKTAMPVNISEQAKTVIEIFNGKIIE